MSAFGTKKRGADLAQQLTFPAVFSETVAHEANPYGYAPERASRPVELPVGDDLQDKYHEQKRLDAHNRVMNAVKDNKASIQRFLHSHQNYALPKPVLSQRRLANPSNGNQADIYSHRPIQWEVNWNSPLQGGVLFTQEAQKWGRQKLKDRVNQLDAINLAKQEFLSGLPTGATAVSGAPSEEFPIGSKVELISLLEGIRSTVESGKLTPLTLADSVKFLRLLFRWATTASAGDLMDVYDYFEGQPDGLIFMLEEYEDEVASGAELEVIIEYNKNLLETMRKVAQYLTVMIQNVDKSPSERKRVSENAIKTLGFTKISKTYERRLQEVNERLGQSGRQYQRELQQNRFGYDDRDDGNGSVGSVWEGNVRSDFSDDPREDLSRRSGAYSDDFSGEWSSSQSSSSSSSDGSSQSSNPFRNMRPAEMSVEEGKQEAPKFGDISSRVRMVKSNKELRALLKELREAPYNFNYTVPKGASLIEVRDDVLSKLNPKPLGSGKSRRQKKKV